MKHVSWSTMHISYTYRWRRLRFHRSSWSHRWVETGRWHIGIAVLPRRHCYTEDWR